MPLPLALTPLLPCHPAAAAQRAADEAARQTAEAAQKVADEAARQTAEAGNVITRAFKKLKFW
jgi:hypothetical protein